MMYWPELKDDVDALGVEIDSVAEVVGVLLRSALIPLVPFVSILGVTSLVLTGLEVTFSGRAPLDELLLLLVVGPL